MVNNLLIHPITAPSLTEANYGDNLSQQFENIDANFHILGNQDFIKGQPGNGVKIENVKIIKPDNMTSSVDGDENIEEPSIETSEGIGLYEALKKAVEDFTNGTKSRSVQSGVSSSSTDDIMPVSAEDPLSNIGDYAWDDNITNGNFYVPVIIYENKVNDTKEYICSAGVVSFFDNRFSASALDKNQFSKYSNNVVDVTSLLNFKKIDGVWTCELNLSFPRLKYKDNAFYWVINDDDTPIKSTGIKGDRGEAGTMWIGKVDAIDIDNDNSSVKVDGFLENGVWVTSRPDGMKVGDSIVVYCSIMADTYNGFFITQVSSINNSKVEGTNDVQKEAYVIYKQSSNISYINYEKNTIEFLKLIGAESTVEGTQPARGLFLLIDQYKKNADGTKLEKKDDISNTHAHMIYNNEYELNISPVETYEFEGDNKTPINNENLKLNIDYKTNIKATTIGKGDNVQVTTSNYNNKDGGIHVYAAPGRSNYFFGPNNPGAGDIPAALGDTLRNWSNDFGNPNEKGNTVLDRGYPLVIANGDGGNITTASNLGKIPSNPSYIIFGAPDIIAIQEKDGKYEKQTLCLNQRTGFYGPVNVGQGGLIVDNGNPGLKVKAGGATITGNTAISAGDLTLQGAFDIQNSSKKSIMKVTPDSNSSSNKVSITGATTFNHSVTGDEIMSFKPDSWATTLNGSTSIKSTLFVLDDDGNTIMAAFPDEDNGGSIINIKGETTITGNTTIDGKLTVANDNGAEITGDTKISGDSVGISGDIAMNGDTSIKGTFKVLKDVEGAPDPMLTVFTQEEDDGSISKNINITGKTDITGKVDITGNTTINANSTNKGAVWIMQNGNDRPRICIGKDAVGPTGASKGIHVWGGAKIHDGGLVISGGNLSVNGTGKLTVNSGGAEITGATTITGDTNEDGTGLTVNGGHKTTQDGAGIGEGGVGLKVYGGTGFTVNGNKRANSIEATGNIVVTGKINASSGFFQDSDETLKNFHEDIEVCLDDIIKLPKKYFTWKDDDTKTLNIGTSAQEVQKLYPELVSKDDNGKLSVAYDKLSIIALKAIDVLNEKNKELEKRIKELEK